MFSRFRATLPVLVIAVLLAVLSVASAPPASAGEITIVVDLADNLGNGGGDGNCFTNGCTLTEAIELANQNGGHDTITFDPNNAPYQIVLEDPGLPEVDATKGITIDASGLAVGIYGYEQAAGSGLVFTSQPGQPIKDVVLKNLFFDSFQDIAVRICAAPSGEDCLGDVSNVELEDNSSNFNALGGLFIGGQAIEDVTVKNFDVIDSLTLDAIGIQVGAALSLSNVTVRDSTITNVGNVAILLTAINGPADKSLLLNNDVSNVYRGITVGADGEVTDTQVLDNDISAEGAVEIATYAGVRDLTVRNNTITATDSGIDALFIQVEATDTVIELNTIQGGRRGISLNGDPGDNLISENTISGATEDGISIGAGEVVISRNNIFDNNEIGIDLPSNDDIPPGVTPNDAGDADEFNDNPLLNFPELTGANEVGITGAACPGCLVELFLSDSDPSGYGEGKNYITSATANSSGEFTVPICGLTLAGAAFTATATFDGNTSEFSETIFLVEPIGACPSGTPTPSGAATPSATPGPTIVAGDLDCSSQVDFLDALIVLLVLEDLPLQQEQPCPSPLASPNGAFSYGDVDCSGAVDAQDAIVILSYSGGVTLPVNEPCQFIGLPI